MPSFQPNLARACQVVLLILLAAASAESLVQRSILVDGNMEDWRGVLISADNGVVDRPHYQGDRDGGQSGLGFDDLRRFAVTWDETYLYLYYQRAQKGQNDREVVLLAYIDRDYDGAMTWSDGLLAVRFTGDSTVDAGFHQYVPFADPDPMPGDGSNVAGYGGARAIATVDGRRERTAKTEFEVRIPWAQLSLTPGRPLRIKPALGYMLDLAVTTDEYVTLLPAGVKDNCEVLDTGELRLSLDGPRVVSSGSPNVVTLGHEVRSPGNILHTAELSVLSDGFRVELFSDPNRDGDPADGVRLGIDATGNGLFTDAGDLLSADSTGDLLPDTGGLLPGATFGVVYRVTLPGGLSSGAYPITFTARSSVDPAMAAIVTDTLRVGDLTIIQPLVRRAAAGTEVASTHEVCSHSSGAVLVDVEVAGPVGWGAVATPTSLSLASNECAEVVVRVTVPAGAVIDEVAAITTLVRLATAPGVSDSVTDQVQVSVPLALREARSGYGLAGTSVFYSHRLVNATSMELAFDLVATTAGNSLMAFWSDPNGDGLLGDGLPIVLTPPIAANGGEYPFIIEIQLDARLLPDAVDVVQIRATADGAPSVTATADDTTRIRLMQTYGAPPPAMPASVFTACAEVYVQAAGIDAAKVFRFRWFDANDSLVRQSPQILSSDHGRVEDVYSMPLSDPSGVWRVELYQRNNGGSFVLVDPGGQDEFTARSDLRPDGGLISLLIPSRTSMPPAGGDLTLTAAVANTSSLVYQDSVVEYTIYHDDDSDLTLDVGEPYVMLDGSSSPWSRGSSCRSSALPTLNPGDTYLENACTIDAIDFSATGAWTILARWQTRCLAIIAERTTSINVGCASTAIADAGSDRSVCGGQPTRLGTGPPVAGQTYSWSPPIYLDNPTSAQPWATPPSTIEYTLIVTEAGGCSVQDNVVVVVSTPPTANAGTSERICVGESAIIGTAAVPGYQYAWTPVDALDDPTASRPTATPVTSTSYTLTVTDVAGNGCSEVDTVTVDVNAVVADPGPDIAAPALLGPTLCNPSHRYSWSPSGGLSDPSACNPLANPIDDTDYCVTVVDQSDGCSDGPSCAHVTAAPCGGLAAIGGLRAARRGVDVDLLWGTQPAARGGYHGYRMLGRASLRLPPASGTRVINTVADVAVTTGTDPGAVAAVEPLFFYQLLAVCADGVTEGP